MSGARYLVGDVFERLAELPDGSVDLVLTSPPFLALRSYLPADHPDKGKEIGSEPDPAAFLDTLLALAAEWRRVLAPHGSIAVELGDTYAGSGGAGGDYAEGGLREGQPEFQGSAARNKPGYSSFGGGKRNRNGSQAGAGWPLPKSLCGIPHLFHLSLAYGRNLLTGEPSPAGQWRVRNVIAWCRPNPPVGALGDKFRPATSYMTVACVSGSRYFDLDAVRGNPEDVKDQRVRSTNGPKQNADPTEVLTANYTQRVPSHPNGAPPLDWWEIPTAPYAGAHYATWPPALCVKPIKAMVPERVCTTCGKPSERIVENPNAGHGANAWNRHGTSADKFWRDVERPHYHVSTTLGWSDCGCSTDGSHWRRGVVLDPFAGSGTTLAVATGLGRDAIGIELDERNADLARDRVGMFLNVEDERPVVTVKSEVVA